MSDNWVVQNLENALNTWNEKLAEIWTLITQSPDSDYRSDNKLYTHESETSNTYRGKRF